MVDYGWWKDTRYEKMVTELNSKGVDIVYYRDPYRPRDKTLAVYERKAFVNALGKRIMGYNARGTETYIEVADAFWLWVEVKTSAEEAKRLKDLDFELRYQSFAAAMDAALSDDVCSKRGNSHLPEPTEDGHTGGKCELCEVWYSFDEKSGMYIHK